MKKIVFLLGGAGNVFFQLLRLKQTNSQFVTSDFFIHPKVSRILGHTNHPNVYANIFKSNKARFAILYSAILFIDLLLAKMFKKTLFSVIDLRGFQGFPVFNDHIYLGYFQKGIDLSQIRTAKDIVLDFEVLPSNLKFRNVVHIRGGDFIKYGNHLSSDYYKKAISKLFDKLEDSADHSLLIVTNDIEFASGVMVMIENKDNYSYEFISSDEVTDFQIIHSANNLICSNSTFAMTAGLTGLNVKNIIFPKDFFSKFKQSNHDLINIKIDFL